MQPLRNFVPRDQNKTPNHGLSVDEKLSVMEALDHIHVTKQYQGMGCCSVCRKISLKKCSGCSTFYCSIECQTIDWPKHRLICSNHRDNSSDRGSSASTRRMRTATIKNFKEEPYIINDGKSPFTALANQLSKKSGIGANDTKSLANFKIANKQYQNRDSYSDNKVGLNNGMKEQKKNKKITSPKMSWGSKKSSPEGKTASMVNNNCNNNSNSSNNNNSIKRNNSNNKRLILDKSKAVENIIENTTPNNKKRGSRTTKIEKMEVVGTYRQSRDRYWVMPVSDLQKYEEIQALLNKECTNYESVPPKVGLVCGCTFMDEWFRGEILTITPDVTVHFIDYGNVFNYDARVFKQLPDNLQSLPGLAFQIEFEEGTPRQYKTEDLESLKITIEETARTSDGISRVRVIHGAFGASEKPLKLAKPPQRKKSDQSNGEEGRKTHRFAVDTISVNSNGMLFFMPGEGKIRYASIVPDNNKEANESIEKVLNIENPNSSRCKAIVGEYVLVTDKEGNEQRGKVALRLGSSYYVQLVDCGNVIMTDTVYPLPDELKGLIELGVKITVEEVISPDQMKRLETCFFAVTGEAVGGKWPCTLKGTEQQIIARVLLEKPTVKFNWKPKLAFLKPGATVEISSIASPNSFYIRSVDVETEQKLLEMNMEMIQFAPKAKDFDIPPSPGELCCAKFLEDGCLYRAIVNSVEKGKVLVMFVDFGNQQETDLKDLKPLPETLKNIPFFAIKVDLKNVSRKPWNNMIKEYIGKLMSENVELTLTFSEVMANGVILREKVSGVVVNDFMEKARDKSETNSLHSDLSFAKKEIYLDDDMTYTKFPFGSTFTLAILYVCEYEFKTGQMFWATAANMKNFNYVNGELSTLICEHCESVSTPYEPTYRELCLAEFEGSWYRAICVEQMNDVFKVFFVDFGNCCEVKSTFIRKMEKQFLKAPALAMNCTISGRDRIKGNAELTDKISVKLEDRINTFIEGVKVTKFEKDTFFLEIPEIEAMLPP